jgi:hypothetical protein
LETDLYPPIKLHLESLGLEVKGEVCGCDLVALSDGSPELVVIGEMKQSFTLELVLQAVDRTSVCDEVWLACSPSRICSAWTRNVGSSLSPVQRARVSFRKIAATPGLSLLTGGLGGSRDSMVCRP